MVEPPLHRVTRTAQHSTTAPRLPSTLPLDSHRPTAPRAGICKLPSAEFPQGPHPIGPQQVLSWVCDIYFSAILKGTLANETVYHLFASQIKRKWWFHCWRFSLFFLHLSIFWPGCLSAWKKLLTRSQKLVLLINSRSEYHGNDATLFIKHSWNSVYTNIHILINYLFTGLWITLACCHQKAS